MVDENPGRRARTQRWAGDDPDHRTVLDVEARELLHLFPIVSSALAITGGAGAVLAETGCYASPTSVGDALMMETGQIALRTDAPRLHAAVGEDRAGDLFLDLCGAEGQLAHRLRPLTDTDRLVIAGLAREGAREQTGRAAAALGGAVAPVRIPWEEGDQLSQLDAALESEGILRRYALADGYTEDVRAVDPAVVPALFDHLCSTQLPVGIAVFSGHALQITRGGVQLVTGNDEGVLGVAIDAALAEFDLRVLREALIVRSHGPLGLTSGVELYDADGRIISMISQFGVVAADTHHGWERIVEQIPGFVL